MNANLLKVCTVVMAAFLAVSGCASSDDPEPAAGSPTSTTEVGERALVPEVEGYAYDDSDVFGFFEEEFQAELDAVNVEEPGAFLDSSIQVVTGPHGAELLVMGVRLGPAMTTDPMTMDLLPPMMAASMAQEGLTISLRTVRGVEVAQGANEEVAVSAWVQDDLLLMVVGEDLDSVKQYSEALIEAVRGQ